MAPSARLRLPISQYRVTYVIYIHLTHPQSCASQLWLSHVLNAANALGTREPPSDGDNSIYQSRECLRAYVCLNVYTPFTIKNTLYIHSICERARSPWSRTRIPSVFVFDCVAIITHTLTIINARSSSRPACDMNIVSTRWATRARARWIVKDDPYFFDHTWRRVRCMHMRAQCSRCPEKYTDSSSI